MTGVRRQSAGLLLYRREGDGAKVLLGHPGGPFWHKKDLGSWSPKGLIARGETPLEAAKREFAEETGHSPRGKSVSKRPGGKLVYVTSKVTGIPQSFGATCLRWNGRRDPDGGRYFPNWTGWRGLTLRRRGQKY
jgi:predicted NUDIX family NTP pyrophosphohydrolase